MSIQESPISIDERVLTLRPPLAKNCFATFRNVYASIFDSSAIAKDKVTSTPNDAATIFHA